LVRPERTSGSEVTAWSNISWIVPVRAMFWPSDTDMCWAMTRAMVSVGPPAANGTSMMIGRDGKACAAALCHSAGTAIAPAASRRNRRRREFISIPLAQARKARKPSVTQSRAG
jgi:hypothetical protein